MGVVSTLEYGNERGTRKYAERKVCVVRGRIAESFLKLQR
jgi:hypothetical protein